MYCIQRGLCTFGLEGPMDGYRCDRYLYMSHSFERADFSLFLDEIIITKVLKTKGYA